MQCRQGGGSRRDFVRHEHGQPVKLPGVHLHCFGEITEYYRHLCQLDVRMFSFVYRVFTFQNLVLSLNVMEGSPCSDGDKNAAIELRGPRTLAGGSSLQM